ncbi:MAG: hypothetical protein ACK5S6_05515, partial [bacterium]
MSERELPPLRVKILGDSSDFEKSIKNTVAAANNAKANAGAARTRQSVADAKDRWKGLQMFMRTEGQKTKLANASYLKRVKFNSKVMEDQQKASDKAAATAKANANKKYTRELKFNSKVMEDQQKASDKVIVAARVSANKKYTRDLKFNSKVQE